TLEQARDRLRGGAIGLDHQDAPGTPGRRLQAQGAASRKGVEHTPARQVLAEPVEERLADPVRRGSKPRAIGHGERRAAPDAADDADRAHCRPPPGVAAGTAAPSPAGPSAAAFASLSGPAPTTTVLSRSGSILRRKASRTCSRVTASTRSIQTSSQSSGSPSSPISASWPRIFALESMRRAKPPTRFDFAAASSSSVGPSWTNLRMVERTSSSASSVCSLLVCRPTRKGPGWRIGMKYEYTL